MKTTKLLSQLSSMETMLNDFSFEELNSSEGAQLKKSFEAFKQCLESKMFRPNDGLQKQRLDSEHHDQFVVQKNRTKLAVPTNATMLIAKVSHEIRTPLNGIIGFTDLLKEGTLDENQLEKVEAIQTASHSLMEIINELLEYSKLSEGLEQVEHIDFNFYGVIQNVIYLCNTLITEKNVVLKTDIEPGIPRILNGDPTKLTQILLNLLGNAIKFVEKGEIKLTVFHKNQRNKDLVLEFVVSDTGIGISKEHLGHIFESFKQAEKHTNVKYGGSGLGLSIVKQIIELMDGTIEVDSKLGKGTTFKFAVPFRRGESESLTETQTPALDFTDSKKLIKGMRILVFEDNVMNQRLFKQRLKFWSCRSYVTDDGAAGIDFLEKHKIDLILMDLRMPGMDGFEITRKIRNHKNKAINEIPIIAVSADFTVQEKKDCDAYGIDDFILKPFSPEELLSKIIRNTKDVKGTTPDSASKAETMEKITDSTHHIDLKPLYGECMGEMGFLEELVRLFKQNALEFIGAFSIHLKNGDFESLALASHKIKSGLAMVHSNSLLDIAKKVQANCRTKQDKEELKTLKESFLREYQLVERAIDIEMEELGNTK